MNIRILDLGTVSWLRSQSIYHGIAYAMRPGDPDTITLMSPDAPYVCVGFHQEVAKEIDVDYCRANGIPIARREIGGGAVYLDHGQIFWHVIFQREHLPLSIEDLYAKVLRGPVDAHNEMGIAAYHRPVNDIQVAGKKIGGTGAATIGGALVVAGSLIMDFNYELMARVLKVPSEKFRDKVFQTLNEYLTTITRELGDRAPSRDDAKRILVKHFAAAFGAEAEYGTLTEREVRVIEELDSVLASDEWTFERGGMTRAGVKIAEGVHVREAAHKAPGGLIRATVTERDGLVDDIVLSGDFFCYPPEAIPALERSLTGVPLEQSALEARIAVFLAERNARLPGIAPSDIAKAIALTQQPVPTPA